jgi:hypothetical protein
MGRVFKAAASRAPTPRPEEPPIETMEEPWRSHGGAMEEPPTEERLEFFSLTPGRCKFPFGDSNFSFCGARTRDELEPYCAYHDNICHQHTPGLIRRRNSKNRDIPPEQESTNGQGQEK